MKKHTIIIKLLIEHGATRIYNNSRDTPLLLAVWYGYLDIVKMLLDYKAEVNFGNNLGFTSLHYVARYNHLDIAKLLAD